MSEHDSEHSSFIKTPKQLIAVILLAFIVPIAVISVLASLAFHGMRPDATAFTDEAVAKRLKPVGDVVVDPNAPAVEVAAASASPGAAAAAAPAAGPTAAAKGAAGDAAKGKTVYDASCVACHAAGVAGAPKTGDKAAWAPRLKQGIPALTESVLKGKGAMPPKGGNTALSDADIKAAVDFLVNQAK